MRPYSDSFIQMFYDLIYNLERVRSQLGAVQDWFAESDQHIAALDSIYQTANDSGLKDMVQAAFDQLSNYEPKMRLVVTLLDSLLSQLGRELPEEGLKGGEVTSEVSPSPSHEPELTSKRPRRPKPLPNPPMQNGEELAEIEVGGRKIVFEEITEWPELPPRKKRVGINSQVGRIIGANFESDQSPAATLEEALQNAYGINWASAPFHQTTGFRSVVRSTLGQQVEQLYSGQESALEKGLRDALSKLSSMSRGEIEPGANLVRLYDRIDAGQRMSEISETVNGWIDLAKRS